MQIKTLLRDIVISIKFLQEQLDNIDNYLDKSLIFQNPDIIESWVKLARSAEELDEGYDPEYVKDWLQRTETYVGYLLSMRMIHLLFNGIQCGYLDLMKNIINYYNDWEKKEFIKADIIEVLPDSKNLENLKEEITKDYEELNCRLLKARSEEQEMLLHIFHYLMGIMDRVNQILMNFVPSIDDFAKAIDKDLREWTHNFGDDMFKEMKEDLNRNYKEYRTAPYTPELWGRMLDADEEALKMAKVQQLAECNAPKQEHWGEDMKKKMDDNGKLMSQIYSLCHTDDLFDLSNAENLKTILRLLKPDNLSMFYDIVVRRTLIQCEMFPELKAQHDEWLNKTIEKQEDVEKSLLSEARQSKLNEIISKLHNGQWKEPATTVNIIKFLNTVFGRDQSQLDEGEKKQCEQLWSWAEGGGGDRAIIVPANLAGFLSEENLLAGSPLQISNDLFGKSNNQSNNINKGNSKRCSSAFNEVLPFLRKYINKIVRKK